MSWLMHPWHVWPWIDLKSLMVGHENKNRTENYIYFWGELSFILLLYCFYFVPVLCSFTFSPNFVSFCSQNSLKIHNIPGSIQSAEAAENSFSSQSVREIRTKWSMSNLLTIMSDNLTLYVLGYPTKTIEHIKKGFTSSGNRTRGPLIRSRLN